METSIVKVRALGSSVLENHFPAKFHSHCETGRVSPVPSETRDDPVADAETLSLLNLPNHALALPVMFEPLFHVSAKAS
jgi:hypothetical protein